MQRIRRWLWVWFVVSFGVVTASASAPEAAWLESFLRRAERLTPRLLGALGAARKARAEPVQRCFDHALRELSGLTSQARLRARWLSEAVEPRARARHLEALRVLDVRFSYLEGALTRCTGHGEIAPGVTSVEVFKDQAH